MKRLVLGLLAAIAVAITSQGAFAFSIAVDMPTQYTLDSRKLIKETSDVRASNQTLTDVSGYKVLIGSIYNVGVGYELYEVKGKGKSASESFTFASRFQFYDVFLDLPTSVLNFTLGYGKGRVNTSVRVNDPPSVAEADAFQYFAGVGFPIGQRFDLHVAYHAVTAEDQKIPHSGGSSEHFNVSGHTVMAGVRLAW